MEELYDPPYIVTNKIVDLIAEISELIGHITIVSGVNNNPKLRRANRIKTIQASLAIENNTLTVEQITALLNGKRVLGTPVEIKEVKNAYEVYEQLLSFNPYSIGDLLKAHGILMSDLVNNAGHFRTGGVGVFKGSQVVHMAPPVEFVSEHIDNLFTWYQKSTVHPLIKSAVFHYEFEFIHPFSDGNGRMGRLWQSLILGRLHPLFEYLPVENMVYANQEAYYNAIQHSTATADSGPFIEFMLQEILNTLKRHQGSLISQHNVMEVRDKFGISSEQIIEQIQRNPAVTLDEIAAALSVTRRSIEKKIKELRDAGYIRREGSNKSGRWIVNDEV